jgi:diguanylate cyclase (GGDEF)-like protein
MTSATMDHDRQSYELQLFHDVAKALTSSLDLDIILRTILEKTAAYFKPANWCLLMVDEATGELFYAVAVGSGCEDVNTLKLTSGESLARWVMERGEALVIANIGEDSRIDPQSGSQLFASPCSLVCVPVRSSGRTVAIMQLVNIDLQLYNRRAMLLQALADYAAIAIENARAVRRIQELSITDDCTGLYNARHMSTVLGEEVRRSQRFGFEFSVLFLDLDYFKRVNDEYGHLVGSKLLSQVGKVLRTNLRLVDTAFRYGGDEFAILLPQTSREAAIAVARRLAETFKNTEWLADEGISLQLRTSIGSATYPRDGNTPQEVVQRADEMMYQVKQSGRNKIGVAGLGVLS